MAINKRKDCVHKFVATVQKGVWKVEAISLNKRGKPRIQNVATTIFVCSECGAKTEYPDTWERNFVLPRTSKVVAAPKKVTTKRA